MVFFEEREMINAGILRPAGAPESKEESEQ